jgi:hypothetical protein
MNGQSREKAGHATQYAALFDAVADALAAHDNQEQRLQALLNRLEQGAGPETPSPGREPHEDLSRLLAQRGHARRRAREEEQERLSHLLHSLFAWDLPSLQINSALVQELTSLEEGEQRVSAGGEVTVEESLRFELRAALTRRDGGGSMLIETLMEQIGFFERQSTEIGSWAKFFLDVERHHREIGAASQEGEEFLSQILRRLELGGLLRSEHELILYLDAALAAAGSKCDLELLASEVGNRLQGRLDHSLFPHVDLSVLVKTGLTCHQLCRQEAVSPYQRQRLAELKASRDFSTLEDLMLLLHDQVCTGHLLPPAASVLDILQQQGFPIEHRDFRDAYRAQLVSLELGEKVGSRKLCLFAPLESLSGDIDRDVQQSRTALLERLHAEQGRLCQEARSFYQSLRQPLPRADVLRAAGNFAISWELAARLEQDAWETNAADLAAAAFALLPKEVLRLIRPRRGYEFKSRQEFRSTLSHMAHITLNGLQETLASRRASSPYHCGVLLRLALLAPLAAENRPADFAGDECPSAIEGAGPAEALDSLAGRLGVDVGEAGPFSAALVTRLLVQAVPREEICVGALQRLPRRSGGDLSGTVAAAFETLTAKLAPLVYRLAVARARKNAGLSPLPASASSISSIVQMLAPALPHLEATALEQAKDRIRAEGMQGLISRYQPFVETREELAAVTKHHLAEILQGASLEAYGGYHDLGELETLLTGMLSRYRIAPGVVHGEDLAAFLLNRMQPEDQANGQKRALAVAELQQLLPRTNCAACGHASCRQFAHALLKGQVRVTECRQLDAAALAKLEGRLQELLASDLPLAPEELTDRERQLLPGLTEVESVCTRLKILEAHEHNFHQCAAHLGVFKRPAPERFYHDLVRYLGFEAAERLSASERRFLENRGEARVRAGWEALRQASDWLHLESRRGQSGAFQMQHLPLEVGRASYADKIFLAQLSPEDRRRVLSHRLDTHMEDFAEWWNADLAERSDPDYQVQDWDDFAKIIKNAYWHQEHTPAAHDILTALLERLEHDSGFSEATRSFLSQYVRGLAGQEYQQAKEKSRNLDSLLEAGTVATRRQLEVVLSHVINALPRALRHGAGATAPRAVARAYAHFNQAALEIRPDLRFCWEGLDSDVQDHLRHDPEVDASKLAEFQNHPEGKAWSRLETLRAGLVRALLASAWEQARLEYLEARFVTDLFTGKRDTTAATDRPGPGAPIPRLLPGMLRCYLRQRFKSDDVDLESIRSELDRRLQRRPQLARDLLEEALSRHIRHRLALAVESGDPPPLSQGEPGTAGLAAVVDAEIQRRMSMDRQRLLRSLFLLAKMEGNLDSLTALLRGIRETSDIIEAAWLQFTEDRAAFPPPADAPAGGIPLRAALLEDKARVNEYLRHGVPRGENKEVAYAVQELICQLRFHILQKAPENTEPADILDEMRAHGYVLDGIDPGALLELIKTQISHRPQYQKDKIWIYTTAVANALAASNPDLLEAERAFHKKRSRILGSDGGASTSELGEIFRRRGVELAKVKEEMYYQLSELLAEERIASFQKRIEQIVAQLDRKRTEIGRGWRHGLVNRRTVFYLVRQFQKDAVAPTWADYLELLRAHWRLPRETLAQSARPDEPELRERLAVRVGAVLGLEPGALEEEAAKQAQQELQTALNERLGAMERLFGPQSVTAGGVTAT